MKLIAGIAAAFAFLVAVAYGWIMNIMAVANSNFAELTGILILRVVGIFVAPLGVVLGYI
jgi:hypothetical protein